MFHMFRCHSTGKCHHIITYVCRNSQNDMQKMIDIHSISDKDHYFHTNLRLRPEPHLKDSNKVSQFRDVQIRNYRDADTCHNQCPLQPWIDCETRMTRMTRFLAVEKQKMIQNYISRYYGYYNILQSYSYVCIYIYI